MAIVLVYSAILVAGVAYIGIYLGTLMLLALPALLVSILRRQEVERATERLEVRYLFGPTMSIRYRDIVEAEERLRHVPVPIEVMGTLMPPGLPRAGGRGVEIKLRRKQFFVWLWPLPIFAYASKLILPVVNGESFVQALRSELIRSQSVPN